MSYVLLRDPRVQWAWIPGQPQFWRERRPSQTYSEGLCRPQALAVRLAQGNGHRSQSVAVANSPRPVFGDPRGGCTSEASVRGFTGKVKGGYGRWEFWGSGGANLAVFATHFGVFGGRRAARRPAQVDVRRGAARGPAGSELRRAQGKPLARGEPLSVRAKASTGPA